MPANIGVIEPITDPPVNINAVPEPSDPLSTISIAAEFIMGMTEKKNNPKHPTRKVIIIPWSKTKNRNINVYNDASKAAINADVIFSDKVISLNDKVNKEKNYFVFIDPSYEIKDDFNKVELILDNIDNLFSKSKICHFRRIFGKKEKNHILTLTDLENGFKKFSNHNIDVNA